MFMSLTPTGRSTLGRQGLHLSCLPLHPIVQQLAQVPTQYVGKKGTTDIFNLNKEFLLFKNC